MTTPYGVKNCDDKTCEGVQKVYITGDASRVHQPVYLTWDACPVCGKGELK